MKNSNSYRDDCRVTFALLGSIIQSIIEKLEPRFLSDLANSQVSKNLNLDVHFRNLLLQLRYLLSSWLQLLNVTTAVAAANIVEVEDVNVIRILSLVFFAAVADGYAVTTISDVWRCCGSYCRNICGCWLCCKCWCKRCCCRSHLANPDKKDCWTKFAQVLRIWASLSGGYPVSCVFHICQKKFINMFGPLPLSCPNNDFHSVFFSITFKLVLRDAEQKKSFHMCLRLLGQMFLCCLFLRTCFF